MGQFDKDQFVCCETVHMQMLYLKHARYNNMFCYNACHFLEPIQTKQTLFSLIEICRYNVRLQ